ncbi:hypothetical protein MAPG_06188 [Magnaporthiopsis poae ATCC 64411]|uniref:Uncharacterized protein n=1 Tax=Magnaporthiopsis poae (strain ATCC 64411 / 73-15) TaxID=644358 RepID=A0A0C4E1D1_MAGP6|nr:hypothetical protein MAPG_06188 [Magnaporthiopsis poae ATCC 64411]
MQNDRGKDVRIGLDSALTPELSMDDVSRMVASARDRVSKIIKTCKAYLARYEQDGVEKGLNAKINESAAQSPRLRMGADEPAANESPLENRCRPPAKTTTRKEVPHGDHLPTARDIAKDSGLEPDGAVVEVPIFVLRPPGDAGMTDDLPRLRVLVRAPPKDKHLVMQKLESLAGTAAVTGSSGGEDVPALGMAGVGFSMGDPGSAVAKEAAQIIHMDGSFNSVLTALDWAQGVSTAVRTFLQLLTNVTLAALLYVWAVSSGDARRVLIAFLLWSSICTEYLMNVSVLCRDWVSAIVPSASVKYLGRRGTTRRRRMLKSEKRLLKSRFSRDSRAGSRTPVADCLGQFGIDVSWGASDWLGHRYHVNTLPSLWYVPGAQPCSDNRLDHVLAWDQTGLFNNIGLCCCFVGVGLAKMRPQSPRRLSLMVAAALLFVTAPTAAAAWTRAQTVLALNASIGAVAWTSAVTVAVLRTKAEDLEPKWWIAAYCCWAVAFVVAVVGALLRPSVVGRRKVFLCVTLLLAANLNGCLAGQSSSAVDTILTLGPALLVVSLYLMTVLIDAPPDVMRRTAGV